MKRIPIEWLQVDIEFEVMPKVGRMELLRRTILALKPGSSMSFLWQQHNTLVYSAAKKLGVRIRTEKQNGTGVKVWRTA